VDEERLSVEPAAERFELEEQIQEAAAEPNDRKRELALRLLRCEIVYEVGVGVILVEPHNDALSAKLAEDLLLQRRADRAPSGIDSLLLLLVVRRIEQRSVVIRALRSGASSRSRVVRQLRHGGP